MFRFLRDAAGPFERYLALTQMAMALRATGHSDEAESAYQEASELASALDRTDVYTVFTLLVLQIVGRNHIPERAVIAALLEESIVQRNALITEGARIIWLLRAADDRDWDAWDDILSRTSKALARGHLREPDFKTLLELAFERAESAGQLERAKRVHTLIQHLA